MHEPHRRLFFRRVAVGGLLLTPLAATLCACSKSSWPEGMVEIKWDRDVCARCNMVISDRRFAAQISGGPRGAVFKFDDIGCLLFWLRDRSKSHPWMAEPGAKWWVAEMHNHTERLEWLDPQLAHYVAKTSPMGYNFGAVAAPQAGSMNFESMRKHILARGK